MGDKAPNEVRERIWVEKFDHSGEEPKLVETVFVEQTRKVDADGKPVVVTSPVQVTKEPQ